MLVNALLIGRTVLAPTPPASAVGQPFQQTSEVATKMPSFLTAIPMASSIPQDLVVTSFPDERTIICQNLNVLPDFPAGVNTHGALMFRGKILYFPERKQRELEVVFPWPSPDGRWFAYIDSTFSDNLSGKKLIVESADRRQKYEVFIDIRAIYFDFYVWLDNRHLVFPVIRNENGIQPMLVVDPFTGEQTELPSDYPNIAGVLSGPGSRMAFEYSSVVYAPSLDLVLFPEVVPQGYRYLVLWNRQTSYAIARLEDQDDFSHYPLWSPDAQHVAVAVQYSRNIDGTGVEEWFLIGRRGSIERLTRFSDYFSSTRIGDGNWSPDGKRLAFWLKNAPNPCGSSSDAHLAILDIESRQVIDTGVLAPEYYRLPPIWSLDGRYVVASMALDEKGSTTTIMVDTVNGWASRIPEAEGTVIAGWLAVEHP